MSFCNKIKCLLIQKLRSSRLLILNLASDKHPSCTYSGYNPVVQRDFVYVSKGLSKPAAINIFHTATYLWYMVIAVGLRLLSVSSGR